MTKSEALDFALARIKALKSIADDEAQLLLDAYEERLEEYEMNVDEVIDD